MVRETKLRMVCLLAVALAVSACDGMKTYTELERLQRAKDFDGKGEWRKAVIELKNALNLNPSNAEARLLLGRVYIAQGAGFGSVAQFELKRAVELGIPRDSVRVSLATAMVTEGQFQQALAESVIGPDQSGHGKARLLVVRGRAMLGLGRYSEGCKQFQAALELDREYPPAYWGTAECAAASARFDEARKQLEAAVKLDPKNGETWAELGNLERVAGRSKESEEAYDTALKYRPESLDATLGRAATRIKAEKLDGAQKDVQTALAMFPWHPIARHLRGVLEFKKGRYAEARSEFQKVLKGGVDYPATLLWLGMAEMVLGNSELASQSIGAYVQRAPGNLQAQALLAYVRANMGNRDDARERLKILRSIKIDDAEILAIAGSAHLILGEGATASEYYAKAIAAKPADAATRINFARARLRENDPDGAIAQLKEAIRLAPDDAAPYQLLVQTHIDNKRLEEALQSADGLARLQPKSALPRILKARVYLAKKDDESARKELLQALEREAGHREAGLMLALMSERASDWEAARGWYEKVLQVNKEDVPTLLALFGMESRAGQRDKALKALERASAAQPQLSVPALLLGRLYLQEKRYRQVLDATRVALDKDRNNLGLLELRGAAYMALREYGNALAVYRQTEKLDPKSADARYYVATVLNVQGADAEYRSTLAQALKLDPRHFRARLAQARVLLNERRGDDALRQVQQLRKEFPGAADAALFESEVLMAKGDAKAAVGVLAAYHLANPTNWDGVSSLVKAYLFTKQYPQALEVAQRLLAAYPEESAAHDLVAQTHLATGDRDGALRTYREYADKHPKSAPARYALGELYMRSGKEQQEAIKAFREAIALQPDHLPSQQGLATLESRAGRHAEALRIADDVKRQRPMAAVGHLVEGDVLMAKGDAAKAAEAYGRAAVAENTPDAAIRIHRAMVSAKAAGDADTRLLTWLRDHPEEQLVREYFAESLLSRTKNRDAIDQYQILLKRSPQNWLALNNLANIYLLERDSTKALATAEQAYALQPKRPVVGDTLGWIVLQRGDTARALKLLGDAAAREAQNPEIQYHFAAALAKVGERQKAKSLLEKVLSSGQRFSEENEAKVLKDSL